MFAKQSRRHEYLTSEPEFVLLRALKILKDLSVLCKIFLILPNKGVMCLSGPMDYKFCQRRF